MELLIRRVGVDDWREMKRVRLAALGQDRMAFGSTLEAEAAFSDDVWIDRARDNARSPERATWVACRPDGRFVGMMGAHLEGDGAKLFGTWVEPGARGGGVAAKLLDALLGWIEAERPGAPVSLSVNPTFEPAVRLYRSRGFELTGASEPIAHAPDARCAVMIRRR